MRLILVKNQLVELDALNANIADGDIVLAISILLARLADQIDPDVAAAAKIRRQVKLLLLRRLSVDRERLATVSVAIGRIADLDLDLVRRVQEVHVLHVGRVEYLHHEFPDNGTGPKVELVRIGASQLSGLQINGANLLESVYRHFIGQPLRSVRGRTRPRTPKLIRIKPINRAMHRLIVIGRGGRERHQFNVLPFRLIVVYFQDFEHTIQVTLISKTNSLKVA